MITLLLLKAESIIRILKGTRKLIRRIVVSIRSDSKSTIEQLKGICNSRDKLLLRICDMIHRLLRTISCNIKFKYIQRTNNSAGLLLEHNVRIKKRGQRRKIYPAYRLGTIFASFVVSIRLLIIGIA